MEVRSEIILLNERQLKIITHLVSRGKTKCAILSKVLKVSDKTVRNEIRKINTVLNGTLIKSDNDGFFIENENLNLIPSTLNTGTVNFNENYTILQHLLLGSEPTTFDLVADYFNYSPSALQNKIKALNDYAADYNVSIKRKNTNLVIEGSESDKRRLFLSIIYDETDSAFNDINDYKRFFPLIEDIDREKEIIKEAIRYYDCDLPRFYETNLLINIFVILCLNTPETAEDAAAETPETPLEEQIAYRIVKQTGIQHASRKIKSIAAILRGIVKKQPASSPYIATQQETAERALIEAIIIDAFQYYSICVDFSGFLSIFANHLMALVERLMDNNLSVVTLPLSIRDSSVFIYDVAVYISQKLSEVFQILIPESEISLIAIHIGFAIETVLHQEKKIHMALYAFNYPLIEKYIINKINMEYEDRIVITKVNNSAELMLAQPDLLITTQGFIPFQTCEYCQISPLLTEKDKVKIQIAISNAIERQRMTEFAALAHRCFDPNLFFYDESLNNRDIILKFLDLHLQLNGIVDNTFLPSVLKREAIDPTSFMNVFAMPHAFDSNALQSKIAILINPKGIQWGKQTVFFVFLIALNKEDKPAFQPIFDGLANILADDNKITQLSRITTYEAFIEYLLTS